MMETKYVVMFEGVCREGKIKGYYARVQSQYEWSFTDDVYKAKLYSTYKTC